MESSDISILSYGGAIMWPLIVISVLGFMFFFERLLYLHKGQIGVREFIEGIRNLIRKRRLAEALTVCEETPGPFSGMVKAAILNHDRPEPEMRRAVQQAAVVEIPTLEKRIGAIGAIARIAPLLGLLGTLLSSLDALRTLQEMGHYADAEVLSGLLVSAIVSTVSGISIAVMAHIGHHFLYGRLRAIIHDMEWVGTEVMQLLLTPPPDKLPNAPPTPSDPAT